MRSESIVDFVRVSENFRWRWRNRLVPFDNAIQASAVTDVNHPCGASSRNDQFQRFHTWKIVRVGRDAIGVK